MVLRISGIKLLTGNSGVHISLCLFVAAPHVFAHAAAPPPPLPTPVLIPNFTGRLEDVFKNYIGRLNIGSSIHGIHRVPPHHQKKFSLQDVLRASQKAYLGRLETS